MVDIRHKRCLECNKHPLFGLVADKSPTYCANHKKEHMVNIINKRCLTLLCGLFP